MKTKLVNDLKPCNPRENYENSNFTLITLKQNFMLFKFHVLISFWCILKEREQVFFYIKTSTSGEYELSICEKIKDCNERQGNEPD